MQKIFKHIHPYEPFIDNSTEKLIVGTLPPPRFTTGDLKEGDVNFVTEAGTGSFGLF